MAVKFSAFTAKTTAEASNVTEIVGYLSTGNENIRIVPSAFDTTYAFTTVTDTGTSNVDLLQPQQKALKPQLLKPYNLQVLGLQCNSNCWNSRNNN
jgi:hypothetical protein